MRWLKQIVRRMDKWTCWTPWHLDLVQYDKPYCNYVKRAYFDRGKKKKKIFTWTLHNIKQNEEERDLNQQSLYCSCI